MRFPDTHHHKIIHTVQNQSGSLEELFQRTGEYLETRVDLIRLKAIDKSSDAISSLAANIAVIVVVSMIVMMLSIGAALWLGDLLGKSFYGFFIVAGFYSV